MVIFRRTEPAQGTRPAAQPHHRGSLRNRAFRRASEPHQPVASWLVPSSHAANSAPPPRARAEGVQGAQSSTMGMAPTPSHCPGLPPKQAPAADDATSGNWRTLTLLWNRIQHKATQQGPSGAFSGTLEAQI